MIRHHLIYGLAVELLASGLATSAFAIDVEPGDYSVPPVGTNLVALYYIHDHSNTLDLGGVGKMPDSELTSNVFVSRFVHYTEFMGIRGSLHAFVPFAKFDDARIGGVNQSRSDGLGDLTVGATVSPIVAPLDDLTGTNLGFILYTTLPTGNYKFGDVSIGSGTTTFTPQIGLQQGLSGGLFFDAYYDVAFALDHDEGGVKVKTDPAHQLQIYLRDEFKPGYNVAVGYSGKRGGKKYNDGYYTGLANHSDQIRLTGSAFLNPTTQIEARISDDVNVEDGFKGGPGIEFRLALFF